jgi:hypothetical protein
MVTGALDDTHEARGTGTEVGAGSSTCVGAHRSTHERERLAQMIEELESELLHQQQVA